MNRLTPIATSLLAAFFLAGCATKVKLDEPAPVETRQPATDTSSTAGTAQSTVSAVDLEAQRKAKFKGLQSVVYFDYDSYVVRGDAQPVIDGHARILAGDRQTRLMVEGHTDDRGGREYNLALGQKRADAVVRSLVLLGTQESQLEAVSFGKERPAATGAGEAVWARNRRVELQPK